MWCAVLWRNCIDQSKFHDMHITTSIEVPWYMYQHITENKMLIPEFCFNAATFLTLLMWAVDSSSVLRVVNVERVFWVWICWSLEKRLAKEGRDSTSADHGSSVHYWLSGVPCISLAMFISLAKIFAVSSFQNRALCEWLCIISRIRRPMGHAILF